MGGSAERWDSARRVVLSPLPDICVESPAWPLLAAAAAATARRWPRHEGRSGVVGLSRVVDSPNLTRFPAVPHQGVGGLPAGPPGQVLRDPRLAPCARSNQNVPPPEGKPRCLLGRAASPAAVHLEACPGQLCRGNPCYWTGLVHCCHTSRNLCYCRDSFDNNCPRVEPGGLCSRPSHAPCSHDSGSTGQPPDCNIGCPGPWLGVG